MASFFPFGTQYHRAPTPLPAEWEGDLKQIAQIGYTHVQYRPQWRWHERVQGEYVFDDLDQLFDLAHQNHLRVIFKPMLETAPDWVFQQLGGTRIGFHDVPISPMAIGSFYVGGWLPCFDNPQVMGAAGDFVRVLVERYREHPALWFYDAWNEPRSRPLGQCHCEHSIRSYQNWLGKQFGSIEALNEKFGKAWTSLQSIRPPASAGDYVEMYLWRQWAAQAVADHVRAVVDTMHEADPERTVLAHAGFCSVLQDPAADANDDILTASGSDRYGTSYPVNLWPKLPTHHTHGDLISDWLRRVDSQYWCQEFYPNEASWCDPPSPITLDQKIWMALAGGTTGFTFWQYRSERLGDESNGWGMREINGEPTPRSEVCDNIARVLKQHGNKLAEASKPPANIGLMYSRASDLVGRIELMAKFGPQLNQTHGTDDYPYKKALYASHFMYQTLGYTTDMLTPDDELAGRSVVHISAMEMMPEATASRLQRYVQEGGTLVVEYPFACRDDKTWVALHRPTHDLHTLLGCREGFRVSLRDQTTPVRFEDGKKVDAAISRVNLIPLEGEPIAWWQDGEVAAVRHGVGKGRVYTLGVNLSLSMPNVWENTAIDVLEMLLQEVGMTPALQADRGVFVRTRTSDQYTVWFVFNTRKHEARVHLPVEPTEVWHTTGGVLSGKTLTLQLGASWVGQS